MVRGVRLLETLPQIAPLHVAAWIEELGREVSAPTVKQRLAAVRHLFDWLVRMQVVPVNPAASAPAHSVRPLPAAGPLRASRAAYRR